MIDRTVPNRSKGGHWAERGHLDAMRALGAKNKLFRSYIGMGFSNTVLPIDSVCPRTLVRPTHDTKRRLAGAFGRCSDHDGGPYGSADRQCIVVGCRPVWVMHMLHAARPKEMASAKKFFVDAGLYPHIDVLRTRCTPIGAELVVGDVNTDPADGHLRHGPGNTPHWMEV